MNSHYFRQAGFTAATLIGLLLVTGQATAAPVVVSTPAALTEAVKAAKPGAIIALADGRYKDFQVSLRANGSEDAPVLIQAQTPGKVILTGESSIEIDGSWMVLSGMVFTDGNPPAGKSANDQTSSAIKVKGNHNRATEMTIIDYSQKYKAALALDATKTDSHRWVGIWGQYNRVDHSYFQGKFGPGVLITVWRDTDAPDYHQIDHNAFRDVAYGNEQNGWETMRIGTSTRSQSNSYTVVEHNYFDHCDGEIEIISNKSGSNTFRFNTFNNSRGTLTMRHGKGSTVENNAFFIDSKSLGGGIRVSDSNHVIRNNYIEGIRGHTLHWSGILLLAHSKDAPINDYWPVSNVVVENNAIVNSMNSLVVGGGRALQSPVSASIRNNLLCNTLANASETALYNHVTSKEGTFTATVEGNVFCANPDSHVTSELKAKAVPAADMARTDVFLLPQSQGVGFKPFRKTTLTDVGPASYKPHN